MFPIFRLFLFIILMVLNNLRLNTGGEKHRVMSHEIVKHYMHTVHHMSPYATFRTNGKTI